MKILDKELSLYGVVSILAILIAVWVMGIIDVGLNIPSSYRYDTLFTLMQVKTMIDNGWYLHNEFLGVPFELDFHDFPLADGVHFLLMKIISFFRFNCFATVNLYFILTFPLTAITTTFVFRCLKFNRVVSSIFALLYAFSPYHFLRGQGHLFLAAYYIVPLAILLALSLWSDVPPFFSREKDELNKYKLFFFSRQSVLCIIICLVAGSSGVYYAFFSCFFIVISCISACFEHRRKSKYVILSSLILVILIFFSTFLNVIPNLVFVYENGANPTVIARNPQHTEILGLKVVNLLLPTLAHRLPALRDLGNQYAQSALPITQNENASGYIGLIAVPGFLYLIFIKVFRLTVKEANIYDRLAVLNLSAVLMGSIGGFSILFSLFVSPQIRAYNRLSIFIAFLSLLTVALLIDEFLRKHIKTNQSKAIFNFALFVILILGIFEQTLPAPGYAGLKNEYENDRAFVHSIEQTVDKDSMIFQLPYVPFPDYPQVNKMGDYDLFRGYLHSQNLKWSYGAMKGRNSDWHRLIAEEPLDDFLTKISIVGFRGIYVDRYGYADDGKQIEIELQRKLSTQPIISKNNRLLFFDMKNFNESLQAKYPPEEIEAQKNALLKVNTNRTP